MVKKMIVLLAAVICLTKPGVCESGLPKVSSKALQASLDRYEATLAEYAKEYDLRVQTALLQTLRTLEKETREQTRLGNLQVAEALLKSKERLMEMEKVPCRAGDLQIRKTAGHYLAPFDQERAEALAVLMDKTKQAGQPLVPLIKEAMDSAQKAGNLREVIKLKQLQTDLEQVRIGTAARYLWLDLLKEIDLTRDALSGRWTPAEDGVQGFQGYLSIPLRVEGDNQIAAAFTRHKTPQNSAVEVDVPIGEDRRVNVVLDGYKESHLTGFSRIRTETGEMVNNNGLGKKILLDDDREYALEITVLQQPQTVKIEVQLDGQPILHWEGPPEAIKTEEAPRIRLSAGNKTTVTFHQVRLRILNGRAIFDPAGKQAEP